MSNTISETQLSTWSNQGATTSPMNTHHRVRRLLEAHTVPLNIFLQGSYASSTNIYADSDVDIVAQCQKMYYADYSALTSSDQLSIEGRTSNATYGFFDLRRDVQQILNQNFKSVESGSKAFKLIDPSTNYEADVIPCIDHRKYYYEGGRIFYHEGIAFLHATKGHWITNFPKQHITNGSAKNNYERTKYKYKKNVRIFKNMKCNLVNKGHLLASDAPSYFVENLLYLVPDKKFDTQTFGESVSDSLHWLLTNFESMGDKKCQNGISPLFSSSSESWNKEDALKFISKASEL